MDDLQQRLGLDDAEYQVLIAGARGDRAARETVVAGLRQRFALPENVPLGRALWNQQIVTVEQAILLDQLEP